MSNNVSDSNPATKLQGLLKKHEANKLELKKYEESSKALANEEKLLLETVDLSDPKSFKKISDVRLKKELVPRKIESLREQEQDILSEINMECFEHISILRDKLTGLQREGLEIIGKALGPFFGLNGQLWEEAGAVFKATNWGIQSNYLLYNCFTEGFVTSLAISKARQLLGYASDVEKLLVSFHETFPEAKKTQKP